MSTDLERLHKVVSGERTSRGCGKTFARCHEIAGAILLGGYNNIIVAISYERDIDYIMPMLIGVLDEYGISHEPLSRTRMKCGPKIISFMAHLDGGENDTRMRGVEANYVPMRHWD